MSSHDEQFPADTDERQALDRMLDVQRAEIDQLLDRVDDVEARGRLVPSLTTVLGLVKHATFVEDVWFSHRMGGLTRAALGLSDTVEESFVLTEQDTVASVRAGFAAACTRSRAVAAQHPDLSETFAWRHGPISLRATYLHLVQEYARHAGHGDILVEQLVARRAGQ